MRNFIFSIILGLSIIGTPAGAQNCTPDNSFTVPGFYPDSLAHGSVGNPYKETLHILVVEDSTVEFSGQQVVAVVDSAVLLNISGIPDGFTYYCDTENCLYEPKKVGCATLEGNPDASHLGTHQLKMTVKLYAKIFSSFSVEQVDTIDQFVLNIGMDGSVSVSKNEVKQTNIYPNPSSGIFTLSKASTWTCYSSNGQIISHGVGSQVNLTSEKSGIYTLQIQSQNEIHNLRLLKI